MCFVGVARYQPIGMQYGETDQSEATGKDGTG